MPTDDNGVLVTTRDIYDQLVTLNQEVRTLSQTLIQTVARADDHETRLRTLEQWRYALPASLLLGLGSLAAQFFK
jgi:hypothetical protein